MFPGMHIICVVVFILFSNQSTAQNACPSTTHYSTLKIRDDKDTSGMRLPLHFIFSADSIIISLDPLGKNKFATFKIFTRECFWNKDRTEGKTIYKTLLVDENGLPPKQPSIILYGGKNDPRIELLYEHSEKRIFYPIEIH